MNVSERELRWLLDGLTLEQKPAHEEVHERTVIWSKPLMVKHEGELVLLHTKQLKPKSLHRSA